VVDERLELVADADVVDGYVRRDFQDGRGKIKDALDARFDQQVGDVLRNPFGYRHDRGLDTEFPADLREPVKGIDRDGLFFPGFRGIDVERRDDLDHVFLETLVLQDCIADVAGSHHDNLL